MKHLLILMMCLVLAGGLDAQEGLPNTRNRNEEGLTKNINDLAFKLYGALEKNENLVISPFDVSTLFSLAFAGSSLNTQSQIARFLNFQYAPDMLKKLYESIGSKWMISTKLNRTNPVINIFNAIWLPRGMTINQDYDKFVPGVFWDRVRYVEFNNRPELARSEINQWIRIRYQTRLGDFLKPTELPKGNQIILTGYSYFRGEWQRTFDPKRTIARPFFPDADHTISVPSMQDIGVYPFHRDEGYSVLEIPYKALVKEDSALSLLIILPNSDQTLSMIEPKLNQYALNRWLQDLETTRTIKLSLPRFKIVSTVDIRPALEKMGLVDAFNDHANFSTITAQENLKITRVIVNALYSADEGGTEASYATFSTPWEFADSNNPLITFTVDKPFMFMVIDKPQSLILFMGRVVTP